MKAETRAFPGQASPARSRRHPGQPRSDGWTVRTPRSFLRARTTHRVPVRDPETGDVVGERPLKAREMRLVQILDGYCRDKAYCWPSNRELADDYGCSQNTVQELLADLERDGIIHRVVNRQGKVGRLGIVLLKRADPDLPVACPDDLPEVVAAMRAAIEAGRRRRRARIGWPDDPPPMATPAPEILVTPAPEILVTPAPETLVTELESSLSLNHDALEPNSPGEGNPLEERQRPEAVPGPSTDSRATPGPGTALGLAVALSATLAPAVPAAALPSPPPRPARLERPHTPPPATAPAESDPPTPGQLAWLATLDEARRARFDELPAKSRGQLLAPHRDGLNGDRILAAEAARVLAPRAAEVPPPMPATTAELWGGLRGAPPGWVPAAAEALARDFGTDRDRKLWPAFNGLADAVWRGRFPADLVLDALRQAMGPEARNRGAVFNFALRVNGWEGRGDG